MILLTIEFSFATFDGPIVIAVIVNGSFAIEKQTILARFQGNRTVGAQEKLVTIFRVSIGLSSIVIAINVFI